MSIVQENIDALSRRQSELRARQQDLRSRAADPNALADAQAEWHPTYASIDAAAPAPREHESVRTYERRLAAGLSGFSPKWRNADLYNLPDEMAAAAAAQIKEAVKTAVDSPTQGNFADGSLRKVVKTDEETGQVTIEHRGNPRHFIDLFQPAYQTFVKRHIGDTTPVFRWID